MSIDDRLIKGLHSDNEKDRSVAWYKVGILINRGIITKEDSAEFIDLLRSDNYGTRELAVRSRRSGMRSDNEDIRSDAWYRVDTLIDKGIITKEDTEK